MRPARAAGLALGAVALALLTLELGLRLFAPQTLVTEHLTWRSDPAVGVRLAPGRARTGAHEVRLNRLGLRGPELGARAGGERLLVLGDSFAFGAGVAEEQGFVGRLAAALAPEVEVVNGGTPAYGTRREARWLEEFGAQVDPTQLLLAVFVGNDFSDNFGPDLLRAVGGDLFVVDSGEPPPPALAALRRLRFASHLWRFVAARTALVPGRNPTGAGDPGEGAADSGGAPGPRFLALQSERLFALEAERADGPPQVEAAYGATELALDRIRQWCQERGVALSLVLLPDRLQVEDNLLTAVASRVGRSREEFDLERPQRFLAAWAARYGLPVVDLLPSFRAASAAGAALYLPNDSHFSPEGHRRAAEQLLGEIRFGS
jgi:lysophospholipase L1-like esterase